MSDTKKEKKNALLELAVELGTDLLSLGRDKYPEIEKAQRIVAELAKIQIADGMSRKAIARGSCLDYKCNGGFPETVGIFTTEHFPKWICSAVNAIEKCCAIAGKEER